jgi:hypothetical protein
MATVFNMIRICDGLRVPLEQFSAIFRINLHNDGFSLSMPHALAVKASFKIKKDFELFLIFG